MQAQASQQMEAAQACEVKCGHAQVQ
jgi:hypothetical protein